MNPETSHPTRFTLTITGAKLKALLTNRIGALESEITEARRVEAATAAAAAAARSGFIPMHQLGGRNADQLDSQRASLTLVHDLVNEDTSYALTIDDLAMLDLIDVHLRYTRV